MTATSDLRSRLTEANLPPGLLPDNVTGLQYDEASGAFTVTLSSAVKRKISGFNVLYDTSIRGTITEGHVADLKGVKVKVALLKPAVTDIVLSPSGTKLVFTVAGAKKGLPISEFA